MQFRKLNLANRPKPYRAYSTMLGVPSRRSKICRERGCARVRWNVVLIRDGRLWFACVVPGGRCGAASGRNGVDDDGAPYSSAVNALRRMWSTRMWRDFREMLFETHTTRHRGAGQTCWALGLFSFTLTSHSLRPAAHLFVCFFHIICAVDRHLSCAPLWQVYSSYTQIGGKMHAMVVSEYDIIHTYIVNENIQQNHKYSMIKYRGHTFCNKKIYIWWVIYYNFKLHNNVYKFSKQSLNIQVLSKI